MGEIRSTLDIIMEKTKGLSMSEEEKKAFKKQETAGKIRGLIQKYLDGTVAMDKLKVEIAALAEKNQDMVKLRQMHGLIIRGLHLLISRILIGERNIHGMYTGSIYGMNVYGPAANTDGVFKRNCSLAIYRFTKCI